MLYFYKKYKKTKEIDKVLENFKLITNKKYKIEEVLYGKDINFY